MLNESVVSVGLISISFWLVFVIYLNTIRFDMSTHSLEKNEINLVYGKNDGFKIIY